MTYLTAEIESKTRITIDVATAAKWFANISDDDVCQFFVAVSEEIKKWPAPSGFSLGQDGWLHAIGRHLRTCECSTEDARHVLREIVASMDYQETQP